MIHPDITIDPVAVKVLELSMDSLLKGVPLLELLQEIADTEKFRE